MNNIASIAEALEKLGFDTSLQTSLTTYISLQLHKFSIPYKAVKDRDVLRFNLFFQKKDDACSCLFYDAILRKEIMLPDKIVDGIQLRELDKQMNAINWDHIFNQPENIDSIISDIQKLSSSKEGKEYSEQLKVKYWSDTALENIMGISFIKSRYEIAQRFYFIDGNGIPIEEAFRFLNNKWMEKQLRRKPVAHVVETKTSSKPKSGKKRNEHNK